MSTTPNDAARPVAIHQFRHKDCHDWYDARPEELPEVVDDPEFITRVVYTATDYDKLREEVERLRLWRDTLSEQADTNLRDWAAVKAQLVEERTRAEAAEARVEAMSDYRTHHHDWRRACIIAAAYANDQADVDYWHHQVRTLDALNAQGESNG